MYRSDIASDDRKVEALQTLMGHAALFLLVNVVAVGIDLVDGARGDTVLGLDWAYWLLIPWIVLMVIHLISFFSPTSYDMADPLSDLIDNGHDMDAERFRRLVDH